MSPLLILLSLSIAGLFSGFSTLFNKKIADSKADSKTVTLVVMLFNTLLAFPFIFYRFGVADSIWTWLIILISTTSYAFSVYFSFYSIILSFT